MKWINLLPVLMLTACCNSVNTKSIEHREILAGKCSNQIHLGDDCAAADVTFTKIQQR